MWQTARGQHFNNFLFALLKAVNCGFFLQKIQKRKLTKRKNDNNNNFPDTPRTKDTGRGHLLFMSRCHGRATFSSQRLSRGRKPDKSKFSQNIWYLPKTLFLTFCVSLFTGHAGVRSCAFWRDRDVRRALLPRGPSCWVVTGDTMPGAYPSVRHLCLPQNPGWNLQTGEFSAPKLRTGLCRGPPSNPSQSATFMLFFQRGHARGQHTHWLQPKTKR